MTQTENTSRYNPNEHLIQLKSKAGSQDYLPVQWRLVWFRTVCPQGTIDTEEVFVDLDREVEAEAFVWNAEKRRSEKVIKQAKGYARFRAVVTDGKGGRATATGSEAAVDFPDYIEKAETKAVGRALAALGYGTQFAPEFNEEHRIVDAPIDHQDTASHATANDNVPTTAPRAETAASTRQTPPANQKPTPITSAPRNQAPAPRPSQPAPQQNEQAPTEEQAQAKATDQQKSSIQKLCQHVQMSVPDLESMSFIDAKALIAELTAEYKKQRTESHAQPAPAQPKITPQQAERIRNLCKALGESEPDGLAEMAYFDAKALYEHLTAKYKAQKQATPQPATTDAPIQDKATAAMINKAKSRVESLDMLWGDIKRDALGSQVDDKDITVAQYAKISSVIETYEQKKAS